MRRRSPWAELARDIAKRLLVAALLIGFIAFGLWLDAQIGGAP